MKKELEQLAEMFKKTAADLLKKDGRLIHVTYFLHGKNLIAVPELTMMFNNSKDVYAQLMRSIVKQMQPDAIITVDEVYCKILKEGETYDKSKSVEEQGGEEQVMVCIETKDLHLIHRAKMIRKDSYTNPELGEWEVEEFDKNRYTGRFADFYGTSTKLDLGIDLPPHEPVKIKDIPKIDA